jgi:aldose 1-epimerase
MLRQQRQSAAWGANYSSATVFCGNDKRDIWELNAMKQSTKLGRPGAAWLIGLAIALAPACSDNREPTPVQKKNATVADAGSATPADAAKANSPESSPQDTGKIDVKKETWGKLPDGRDADLFTITNPKGAKLKMTNFGAHIVAIEVPDRNGKMENVVLPLDSLEAYVKQTASLGATIGRYANRIAVGKFTLNGQEYHLPINNGPNSLHGGPEGFSHQLWTAKEVEKPGAAGVEFTYVSKDGEAGYPGTLTATATFWLTSDNAVQIDYTAKTDKDTVVNLTNHAYFNLSGDPKAGIFEQEMMIDADKYLEADPTLIPTGKLVDVAVTVYDFRSPKPLGPGIKELKADNPVGGYDNCYVLKNNGKLALAAKATDPKTGRTMEVWTDQPGVQLYSSNHLNGAAINGGYEQYAAFCLETQHYPDSPNHPDFPSTVLKPGEIFKSTTIYKFSAE